MATIPQLMTRLAKLEGQRNADAEFKKVEEYWPGDDFFGPCDIAYKRLDYVIARFPKKLTIEQWTARFNPNSGIDP